MKKTILLLTLIFSVLITQAQDINFTFDNYEITNDGVNDFLEGDVMIAETSGNPFTIGNGQLYLNYSTTAFSSNISANGGIEITRPNADGYIYGQFENVFNAALAYSSPIVVDNTSSRVSIAFIQKYSSDIITGPNVTAVPTKLFHVKMKYIDVNEDPSVCFETGAVYLDLFYTACGGTNNAPLLEPDCNSFPGTQIFNDTFDCAGAVVVGTCSGTSTTWNGSSWLPNAPGINDPVVIAADYNTTANGGSINACTLSVINNSTLTVAAGDYVNVNFEITVANGGTLRVEHEGSLVQVFDDNNNVTNNGTIEVIKTTPVATGNSFSIVGSPMSTSTRGGAYGANNVLMYHQTAQFNLDPEVTAFNGAAEHFADVEGDNWQFISAANGSTQVFAAEGYLLGPTTQGVIDNEYDITYNEGTLNNGVYTNNVIYNTFLGSTAEEFKSNSPNILCNPYASAIDADALITNNAVIDELYFWEHLTAPSAGYPGYRSENWNMGDISIRNMGGSVQAPNGGVEPTQYIASGQGFGIKANAAGTVTFNNSLRVLGNNTGYRNSEIERMYIKISNETYALKSSTLVAFTNAATDDYEAMYDSNRLATPISIYSVLEERELAIQGRSTFHTDQVIPLGFRTMVEEEQTYTISLGNIEGENITQATVYLEDNLLGTITNLSEGYYTFTSNESNQKDRFVIVFVDEQLGNNDTSLEAISIYPNPTSDFVRIISLLSPITNVTVYDLRGRMIITNAVEYRSSYQLDMSSLESAMYFVKITTENGIITERVIRE